VADAPHRQVVDELLILVRRRGQWTRRSRTSAEDAISALWRLVGDEYAAAGLLALAPDWTGVMKTAVSLGRMGWARESEEILLALAQDKAVGFWGRMEAAEALGELGRADEAVKLLLALAQNPDVEAEVRVQVAEALGRLGRANEAAELLLALARDQAMEAKVRMEAAEALERLKRATPEVLAGLRVLGEESGTPESVRQAARWALEQLERESLKR